MTDTTISTDPATLRGIIARLLDDWPGVQPGSVRDALKTLRAIAAEKEAQAGAAGDLRTVIVEGLRGAVDLDQKALGTRSCFAEICSIPPCQCLHNLADAALSAITAAGYEIRPRGEAPSSRHLPYAWWAETGTSGAGEGCNRPFCLRDEAAAYVRKHGGYIAPLYRRWSENAIRPGDDLGGGLVAVPREPTEAMYAAACDPQSIFKYSTPDERGGKIPLLVAVHYRAMLAALTEKGERS